MKKNVTHYDKLLRESLALNKVLLEYIKIIEPNIINVMEQQYNDLTREVKNFYRMTDKEPA